MLTQIQQVEDESEQEYFGDLVTTTLSYKFSNLSWQEVAKMLGLDDFKKAKLAQEMITEGRQEGKLELVKSMRRRGFALEQISTILELEIEQVIQLLNKSSEADNEQN